jgi:hypothetical protein
LFEADKEGLKLAGKGSFQLKGLARDGVGKCKLRCVQEIAIQL